LIEPSNRESVIPTIVKLLKREESHFIFLIGKRERELLLQLLRRYPVVIGGHFRKRHPAKSEEARENQELLEEALADQQKENRQHFERMLAEAGRFKEIELGYTFTLSNSELEWMLQVLNDIRVGSWIQLGEPDPEARESIKLNEVNMQLAWAMEMAGLFEHTLIHATDSDAPY
jgi:hypothetical protein